MSTALVSSFRGASRPQATSDIATSRGVCGVAVGSGRSGVATRRWASLSIAERFTGPNRMRGRLGHALTQLDTCWHLGTQKLRHRSTESTVDLLRSLPWSKGTAAIGILWPSQPQCCGINVWGLQLADWATSWWCGVQQNMYRYLLSTWKLLCCQRCQVMIILKEHMNGRLGEERKKKHPKRKLQVLSQTLTCQQQAPFCQTDLVFAIPANVDLQKCCCHLVYTMIHGSVTHCVFLGWKAKSISTSSGGSNCITLQKQAAAL